jgi:CubicO group peptidase (beta-lactamase class C family)
MRARSLPIVALLPLTVMVAGCAATPSPAPTVGASPEPVRPPPVSALQPASPADVGMDPWLGRRIEAIVGTALREGVGSGAAVAVGRYGRLVHLSAHGLTKLAPDGARVADSTLFDLASLTKVVATTTAAMILEEEGRLQLDRPVAFYLGELTDSAKAPITVRMLLTHRGGLEAYAQLYLRIRGREAYLREINARPLRHEPGTETVYSDWDMVLLQLVIERITGQTLDAFVAERVFAPLRMRDTQFSPVRAPLSRVAATSADSMRGGLIHGVVHDGNAWAIGGVAGHAGLFSSARDLAVFAQMLLNGGWYGDVRILRAETIARWTAPQVPGSSRALGWDTPSGRSSAGRFAGPRAFGHTGFTGTSLWIDPERGLFVVLLTNRVHLGNENPRHVALRRDLADAVHAAVLDSPLLDWESRR